MSAYEDLAKLVRFRPLSGALPPPGYDGWASSPFSATWSSTVALLVREVRHLNAREAVLEIDMREQDFRIDGLPRALRKVDRYGITAKGEQYAGWKQLMSPQDALAQRGRELITKYGSVRAALAATHPDAGGDEEDFKAVTAARDGGA